MHEFYIYFLGGLVALGNPLQLIRIDFVGIFVPLQF